MNHPTCTELGVCQKLELLGPDCSCMHDTHRLPVDGYFFAPGSVQTMPRRRTRRLRRAARRAVSVLMAVEFLALVAGIGFFIGVLWSRI